MKDKPANIREASPPAIRAAASLLLKGELVAFPTETVYGLGANALDPAAVGRIFEAKGRPADNPLIVHVASPQAAQDLVREVPQAARALMAAFWPGPLTLVLPAGEEIPPVVTGGLATVGVRMPDHPVALALLRACALPVAAPSANRSGRPSPTTARHVADDLGGRVPLILDGGPCRVGLESTVLDLTGEGPCVLRPGGVTPQMLEAVIGPVTVHPSVLSPLQAGMDAPSPGMKYRHYAPAGQVRLIGGPGAPGRLVALYDEAAGKGHKAVIIGPAERAQSLDGRAFMPMGDSAHPEAAAQALFGALREAEAQGAELMLIEAVPAQGIGLAVMNRLCRAAGFQMEEG